TRDLSLFNKLQIKSDKSLILRYVLSVDFVLGSAFLTEKMGLEDEMLVFNDATYIRMKPLPMSGYEENARDHFNSKEHWQNHKLFMPLFIRQWNEVIFPYCQMRLSFTEHALLKTLTCYQMVYFRLTPEGRNVCAQQRNAVLAALHRAAEVEGLHDPAQRVGEIIMLMSGIMDYTLSLIGMYFKIKLFDLAKMDPMIKEMCSFQFQQS
ncbi:hypothetical protein PFISCL1PPCAC_6798, partial [Pristionchus fissidentatus]